MMGVIKVGIIDLDIGNTGSIINILKRIPDTKIEVVINPKSADELDRLIFPGVGHFSTAIAKLKSLGLVELIRDYTLEKKKPFLGICLGMQMLSDFSEEGNETGLSVIPGRVVKIDSMGGTLKVPHMGWNVTRLDLLNPIFRGLNEFEKFYFVHSYHYNPDTQEDVAAVTHYGQTVVASIRRGNIFGVQFHPEKSHEIGAKVLRNFVRL